MKHRSEPADDAWPGQRQGDRPERLPRRRAEILGRLDERAVEPLERGVERQHHERQIRVDHADIDGRVRVEDGQGFGNEAEREQGLVEQAFAPEDADPGVDADQEARPERQDDERHEERAPPRRRRRHGVGDRIADEQEDGRRNERDAQRGQRRAEIKVVGEERPERLEVEPSQEGAQALEAGAHREHGPIRWLRYGRIGQADLEDDQEGHEEEQHEPQEGQPGNEGAADALGDPCGARGRHRVRITAASGANERCTRSSQVTGAST